MPNRSKSPFIARGNQRYIVINTGTQNIDNGSGTTVDAVVLAGLLADAYIIDAHPVYTEATDTAGVASANWKLGVSAGGATIVAATALQVSKAIGAAGASVPGLVPLLKGQTLFWRHTGIAATEAGAYFLQITLMLMP